MFVVRPPLYLMAMGMWGFNSFSCHDTATGDCSSKKTRKSTLKAISKIYSYLIEQSKDLIELIVCHHRDLQIAYLCTPEQKEKQCLKLLEQVLK